jgi:acetylornithine deacetylase/succinyl-diaminopimelate desuccinylase-like protein
MGSLDGKQIQAEVTALLSRLIQFDTTNPPGNETPAAEFLAEHLTDEGLSCEVIETAPMRGNVITRLNGTGQKPRLLLLSHLDVVAANPENWAVPPFSGRTMGGYVWGRGALDMKGLTAIQVTALKMLKREGFKPKADVILAATADEEMGGTIGAEHLVKHHREKLFAEYVINEGGGSTIPTSRKPVFTVNTAEKGLLWLKITAKGTSGHGSMPEAADNAIIRMNQVMTKLSKFKAPVHLVTTNKQFLLQLAAEDSNLRKPLMRILKSPEQSEEVLAELEETAPAVADEIRPRLRMTITPTTISGGVKENVIPDSCTAVFDCRMLPGQSTLEIKSLIHELLGDVGLDKLTFETIQAQEPSESPMDTPLYDIIRSVLGELEPGCGVVPHLMAGGTDSRFFRKLGSICYGFHPLRSENKFGERAIRREHGVDERISIENLVFGVNVLYEVVKRFMT